jgi:hypothetical protein
VEFIDSPLTITQHHDLLERGGGGGGGGGDGERGEKEMIIRKQGISSCLMRCIWREKLS